MLTFFILMCEIFQLYDNIQKDPANKLTGP